MDGVLSEHGRAPVLTYVVIGALSLGLVASVYLNYAQAQRADQDHHLLQGQITDLRYQVQQDKQAAGAANATPTPSPSPSATPTPVLAAETTPTPTPTPAAATATVKSFVHLRARATTSSAIVTSLNAGAIVTLGAYSDARWQQITVAGKSGYVDKSYLKY